MKIQITASDADVTMLVSMAQEEEFDCRIFGGTTVTCLVLLSIGGVKLVHFPKAGFAKFGVAISKTVAHSMPNFQMAVQTFCEAVNSNLKS